ncbi:MAG: ERF family protein [Gammaproteobacteria bacterium]
MDVLALLIQRGAEMATIREMMDLQERWEAQQARKAFDAAISAAKAEIKPIVKNREVAFTNRNGGGRTNYMYEDFAQIAESVDPILARHGLSYRHRPKQEGKQLTITCVLSHRDGHSEEFPLTAANDESGNKNSIQAIGSTATFLQRYTLKLALGLAAARDDDARAGGNEVEVITENEAADLKAKVEEVGANKEAFLNFFGVDEFSELPASKLKQAVGMLNEKARRAG